MASLTENLASKAIYAVLNKLGAFDCGHPSIIRPDVYTGYFPVVLDESGKKMVYYVNSDSQKVSHPYKKKLDGKLPDWLKEGQDATSVVPHGNLPEDKMIVHAHGPNAEFYYQGRGFKVVKKK
ncbi:MAG: hypothetical protein M1120_03600 [Patescibacteria group bacterium]|nr:hypothetical protein [Patescibacteria group bacterium]